MGMPLRILKFAIDFFARVITGFLPGDLAQFRGGRVQQLHVGARFAQADIHRYLLHVRHGHRIRKAEALRQRRDGFFSVLFVQTANHRFKS